MKYLHYAPRAEDARLVAEAFRLAEPRLAQDAAGPELDTSRPSSALQVWLSGSGPVVVSLGFRP
jgi:hypothetical protein